MTGRPRAAGVDESRLRELIPEVIGVLVRRGADFASAEDAVQEALLAASTVLNLVMFGLSLIAALGTAFLAGPILAGEIEHPTHPVAATVEVLEVLEQLRQRLADERDRRRAT